MFGDEEDGPMSELSIEVGREELLKILKENLERHKKEYEEARKGWYTKMVLALITAAEHARLMADVVEKAGEAGEAFPPDVEPALLIPKDWHDAPKSYADQYDDAIEMLTMAKDEKITLSRTLWRQLVKDEWEWKTKHMMSNRKYSQVGRH